MLTGMMATASTLSLSLMEPWFTRANLSAARVNTLLNRLELVWLLFPVLPLPHLLVLIHHSTPCGQAGMLATVTTTLRNDQLETLMHMPAKLSVVKHGSLTNQVMLA